MSTRLWKVLATSIFLIVAGIGFATDRIPIYEAGSGTPKLVLASTIVSTPTGTVVDFAGAAAPTGWLLLDGSCLSQATYSALFALLSTTYGDCLVPFPAATHFALPDARGRVIAGRDDMGGPAANLLTNAGSGIVGTTLGAAGGLETQMQHLHALDHDHAVAAGAATATSHTHTDSFNATGTFASSSHTHTEGSLYAQLEFEGQEDMYWKQKASLSYTQNRRSLFHGGAATFVTTAITRTAGGDSIGIDGATAGPSATGSVSFVGVVNAESAHVHPVNLPNHVGNTGNSGTGTTQGNVQPTLVLNKIIKH